MASPDYVLLQRLPTVQEYLDLTLAADLIPRPAEAVEKAVANSFACLLAYEGKAMVDDTTPGADQPPVGIGRLIGDGALWLAMVDVGVHRDHQRKGIGKRIIKALVDYTDEHASTACINVVADPPGQKLYPLYGFGNPAPSIGMFRCAWIEEHRKGRGLGGE